MKVWLDAPDAIAEQLAGEGGHLSREAVEALAAEGYRAHRLTGVEVCRLLDIASRNDLDAFLKRHGVSLEYTAEDVSRLCHPDRRLGRPPGGPSSTLAGLRHS